MIDVARLAGVSHQSVSRVVNGSGSVTPEIRERVERAIEQLRYRRHLAARALATNLSMRIGVISFGLAQHGPSVALAGIADEVLRAGYATNIVSLSGVDRSRMASALDDLRADSVDGIIVLAPVDAAVTALSGLDVDVPFVVFHPGGPVTQNTVVTDEEQGAQLATQLLIEQGHQRIAHVSGPPGWLGTSARIRGWRQAHSASRLATGEVVAGDWSTESGYRAGRQLAADPSVTAVFAANDQMALGVLAALHDQGREVPGDVSVVGFDDLPGAAYFRTPLTTVRFNFAEVGRRAVDHILDLMAGRDPGPARPIEPILVLRASHAVPPAAHVLPSV